MSWFPIFGAGFLAGWWMCAATWPRNRDPDWRRSFNHENINRPTSEPPLRFRRSGDGYSSGPTTPKPGITPKPQFPPPQIIREDFLQ
jgi:hypothetical protein